MSHRSTLIFGNGLGMALDSEYFQLKTALSNVWDGSDPLSDSHKRRVLSILSGTTETLRPESEAQLNDLQIAISLQKF